MKSHGAGQQQALVASALTEAGFTVNREPVTTEDKRAAPDANAWYQLPNSRVRAALGPKTARFYLAPAEDAGLPRLPLALNVVPTSQLEDIKAVITRLTLQHHKT